MSHFKSAITTGSYLGAGRQLQKDLTAASASAHSAALDAVVSALARTALSEGGAARSPSLPPLAAAMPPIFPCKQDTNAGEQKMPMTTAQTALARDADQPAPIFDPTTQEVLDGFFSEASAAGWPVEAVSVVFRDAPRFITGPALEGVLRFTDAGLQRVSESDVPDHLRGSLRDLTPCLLQDTALLCALGDGIEMIRQRGYELLLGQAWLTPETVSVLSVEGRDLGRKKASRKHRSAHLAQFKTASGTSHGSAHRLPPCLRFMSDPRADNRASAEIVRRLVPSPSKPGFDPNWPPR